jgi:hypothetical protein
MGKTLQEMVDYRWYSLSAFAAACASGFLSYAYPSLSWWALLPAGAAALMLISVTRDQSKLKYFILLPILFFLISSAVSVWAAYDLEAALDKFRILLAAVILFFAVAYQPRQNLWIVVSFLGFIGSVYAIYFALTYDWRIHAVDTDFVNRIGERWMDMRLTLQFPTVLDDIAGGVFAVLLPTQAALLFFGIRKKHIGILLYSAATTFLISAGLFLTGLRAGWGALAAGFFISILFITAQRNLIRLPKKTLNRLGLSFMAALIGFGVLFMGFLSGELLPGLQGNAFYWAVRSRFGLFRDILDLSGDFIILGGGLASFPGIYSRYILSIFDYFLGYGHNLYLDLIIEQGVLGLFAFMIVLFTSLWLVVSHPFKAIKNFDSADFLMAGVMVGLITMMIQGLFENSLNGMRGTPFLFLLPALSITAVRSETRLEMGNYFSFSWISKRRLFMINGSALLLIIILVAINYQPIAAAWYANLGSIELAKVELREWPEVRLSYSSIERDALEKPIQHFNKALEHDPNNRAANYRLGRIAYDQRNFSNAITYLERAFLQDQHYHGIRKNLGYSYVFNGQIDDASETLEGISEAMSDMAVYNWWWGTQGRDDLSLLANQYIDLNSQE